MGRRPKNFQPDASAINNEVYEGDDKPKRKRNTPSIVAEQAAEYGIELPEAAASGERFLSPNDIGRILSVTGEAVKQWIYRRKLPAVKLTNGYWKVRVQDFEAFLKAKHDFGKRQVLITAIENENAADVERAVTELGHQAVVAHNYADAMLKAMDHSPALFVVTLSGDAAESWRFADKVRATRQLRSQPILILASSNFSDADTDRAVEMGAQGLLTLPVEYTRLKGEIERIMSRNM